jgi:hypothetical protein
MPHSSTPTGTVSQYYLHGISSAVSSRILGFPTSIGTDCVNAACWPVIGGDWGVLRLRQSRYIRTAKMRAPTTAPAAMPPFVAPDRPVAGAAVALALAVAISMRLVDDVMVEDKMVVDGVLVFAFWVIEDMGVGDEVVFDAQGVVANSHGSTQPYWQPLLSRQLCQGHH